MRLLRGAVIAMTGICAGTTLWVAANTHPVNVGLVLFGLGVSIGGIFIVAFTSPTYGGEE